MDTAASALHIRKPNAIREDQMPNLVAFDDEVHIRKPIANRENLNARLRSSARAFVWFVGKEGGQRSMSRT